MIRFSEWVSALTPTHFTELSLVLFVGVFVAVAFRDGGRRRATAHAEAALLPLADDAGGAL